MLIRTTQLLVITKLQVGKHGRNRFWCKHIVTSPKNVKTLNKQIIADIYQPFSSSADIRNYLQTITSPIVNIRKIPWNFRYLQIFGLRLQTFADIGKNQYFQTYEYAKIRSYPHLYVGCELLPGFADACKYAQSAY